jgi:hypothetical protein
LKIRKVFSIPKSHKELRTLGERLAFGSIGDTSQKKRICYFMIVNDDAQAFWGMKTITIQGRAGIGKNPGSA